MDTGNVLLIGALGVGGYRLWQKSQTNITAAPVVAAAAPVTAAPVVAAAAPVTAAPVAAPVTAPAAGNSPSALDGIYTSMKTEASGDPAVSGSGDAMTSSVSVWGWYLAHITGLNPAPNSQDTFVTLSGSSPDSVTVARSPGR